MPELMRPQQRLRSGQYWAVVSKRLNHSKDVAPDNCAADCSVTLISAAHNFGNDVDVNGQRAGVGVDVAKPPNIFAFSYGGGLAVLVRKCLVDRQRDIAGNIVSPS